jgi:hypothetical protein
MGKYAVEEISEGSFAGTASVFVANLRHSREHRN